MKTRWITSLMLTHSLIATTTFAGRESHGGGALVCPDSVELYDLFEATVPGEFSNAGLHIAESNQPLEEQIQKTFLKLRQLTSETFKDHFLKYEYQMAVKRKQSLPSGMSLVLPDDIEAEFLRTGCALQGVASYNDAKERLLIDESLYNRMSPTHQAALWVHEVLYRVFRRTIKSEDSKRARKIVGYLFSNASVNEYPSNLIPSNLTYLHTDLFEFNSVLSRVLYVRPKIEGCSFGEEAMLAQRQNFSVTYSQHPHFTGSLYTGLDNAITAAVNSHLRDFVVTIKSDFIEPHPECHVSVEVLDLYWKQVAEIPLQPLSNQPGQFEAQLDIRIKN